MASASDYSSDDNFYDNAASQQQQIGEEDDEGVAEIDLIPCANCCRNFNPDVLQRHHNVCTKLKPRKAFDSKKQRMAGLAKITITKPSAVMTSKPKKKNWRLQHEQFINNIRAARVSTKSGSPVGPCTPTINPDYVQCCHCNRRFNETAAERHIQFCSEQKSRIPKQCDSKYASKKEKQDKRSMYKPPLPGQKNKSCGTPTKVRSNSNSGHKVKESESGHNKSELEEKKPAPSCERSKTKSSPSPSRESNVGERSTKSDTTISGHRKKKIADEVRSEERPSSNVTNGRYSKTVSSRICSGGSLSDNDTSKTKTGKSKGGSEPKWFEELKRNDSGNQNRKNKLKDDLDTVDSGMDLNENYPCTTKMSNAKHLKESPVGVVRPSSRTNESVFLMDNTERAIGSGRRKMANFCHDCGTKYPVPEAKFCCECGVRRMALA